MTDLDLRPPTPDHAAWQDAAEAFSKATTKWFLAWLAALFVNLRGEDSPHKVSGREFGRRANRDHKTVLTYVRVWDYAAGMGIVPHRADLDPNAPLDFPTEAVWAEVYQLAMGKSPQPKQRKAKPVTPDPPADAMTPTEARDIIYSLLGDAERALDEAEDAGQFERPDRVYEECAYLLAFVSDLDLLTRCMKIIKDTP